MRYYLMEVVQISDLSGRMSRVQILKFDVRWITQPLVRYRSTGNVGGTYETPSRSIRTRVGSSATTGLAAMVAASRIHTFICLVHFL